MRVMHIANEMVSTGNGIVNATVDLACTQAAAGADVTVVSSGGGFTELLKQYGVQHYENHLYFRSPLKLAKDLPRLKKIVAEVKPDIVHAHMMTTAVLMRLGRDFAGFGNYGLVTTIHNEWRPTSKLMQVGDRVIVLSENGRKVFKSRGFPEHKLQVVRHGILNSPRRRDEIQAPADSERMGAGPTIVTIAGLYKRKGIGELIEAFSEIAEEFPTASLHIVGWGPDQEYFEQLCRTAKGADRIHMKGFIAKPHTILRKADIFVLASHTEAFPLAVAEAREAGCAIIATPVGGVPELLDQGEAGILVPPREPHALAQALRTLLGTPGALQRGRTAARSNLEWLTCERMSAETLDVYRALIRARSCDGAKVPASAHNPVSDGS